MKKSEAKNLVTLSLLMTVCPGPRLWDKPISLPVLGEEEEEQGGGGEYDVMSMEDFLMENNISMDDSPQVSLFKFFSGKAVLGILDILVRIRIRGSEIRLLSSLTSRMQKNYLFFIFLSNNLPAGTLSSVLNFVLKFYVASISVRSTPL
jgi:hypothetical protein